MTSLTRGLGKTLQALAFLAYMKHERGVNGPHLIVVPLAVLHHWGTEIARFVPTLTFCKIYGGVAERTATLSRPAQPLHFKCGKLSIIQPKKIRKFTAF